MRTDALVLLLAACSLSACSKDDGAGSGSATAPAATAATGSAAKKGTGFSASLSAELAKEGSSAPSVPLASAGSGAGPVPNGSAANGSAASGSTVAMAGAAAKGSNAGMVTTKGAPVSAPTATAATTTAPASGKPTARVAVKPPPELAAIKIDLEPNWERDIGEAGTISFVLNVPNSSDTRLFVFHYGYDPSGAPDDRDAYMKWLADNKLLSVSLNRQRGAAWYLEGSDGNGVPAFRTLVMYGGKHLVCWGTLYKDAASNPLGDLRDKVVMTAKQICGTMAL